MSKSPVAEPVVKVVQVDEIVPYWRNPRHISEEAVAKVAASIERYGYQAPIIVDDKHVIITGHTRYAALRRLGVAEVPVIVADLPAKRANEYRVIDNRSAEYSTWDDEKLLLELRELSGASLAEFFPDVNLGDTVSRVLDITEQDVDDAFEQINSGLGTAAARGLSMTCPSCFHEFEVPGDRIVKMAEAFTEGRGR